MARSERWLAGSSSLSEVEVGVFTGDLHPTVRAVRAVRDDFAGASIEWPVQVVFVASQLRCRGTSFSGTYGLEPVPWVAVAASAMAARGRGIGLLHHETSSLLLATGRVRLTDVFPEWSPPPSVLVPELSRWSHQRSAALKAAGFINEYATTSPENDFNELVEAIYTWPLTLEDEVEGYPALLDKLRAVLGVYASLYIHTPDFPRRLLFPHA